MSRRGRRVVHGALLLTLLAALIVLHLALIFVRPELTDAQRPIAYWPYYLLSTAVIVVALLIAWSDR